MAENTEFQRSISSKGKLYKLNWTCLLLRFLSLTVSFGAQITISDCPASGQDLQVIRFFEYHAVQHHPDQDDVIDRKPNGSEKLSSYFSHSERWVSTFCLLRFPEIQSELKLTAAQVTTVNKSMMPYQEQLARIDRLPIGQDLITLEIDESLHPYEELKLASDRLGELLSKNQLEHLGRIERYLWLRHSGVAFLLKTRGDPPSAEVLERVKQLEAEIWKKHAKASAETWQKTIENVKAMLLNAELQSFPINKASLNNNPIWPDLVVFALHNNAKFEKHRTYDSVVEELIAIDNQPTTNFFPLMGNLTQLTVEINREQGTLGSHLDFLINSCWWENHRTGTNLLSMIESQFQEYSKIQGEIGEEYQSIEKELNRIKGSATEDILRRSLVERKMRLNDKLTRRIVEEVFVQDQVNRIVELYRNFRNQQNGPLACILTSDSLPEKVKGLAEDEFANFEKRLLEIEMNCHSELIKLYNSTVTNQKINISDRPSYLLPSMYFLVKNSCIPRIREMPRVLD